LNLEVRTENSEVEVGRPFQGRRRGAETPALRILLIALLTLAIAAPASAAWRRVDTPHFIIVGDVSARELRATATKFEGFHEALRRVLPSATTSAPVPTVVIVFPTDAAFTPFKPQYQGKPRPVAGYAAPGLEANYIALTDDGDFNDRVIFHEYTHMVIANAVARLPLWLNEGLAEFYSTFALMDGGKRAQIGRPVVEHLALLDGSLRVPLADLLRVDHQSPLYNEGNRVSDFYAESWALTHMLLNGQPSRVKELSEYLRRIDNGASQTEAWEQIFGTSRTDGDLRRYVKRPTYLTVLIDFAEKVSAVPMTETPMSAADSAAFLAQLQLRTLGPDAAARILGPVLKQEPAHAHANAAMARVELARHDPAGAAKRLLTLAANDWLVAYTAGVTLTEAAQADRSLAGPGAAALTKASQLLEDVRRTRADLPNMLASLAAVEVLGEAAPPSAAAREHIARARALAPGRIDYALIQAELFANARDFASARAAIGPLMTPVYSEDVRNAARRLMGGLVELERGLAGATGSPARSAEAATIGGAPAPGGESRSVAVPDADQDKPRDTAGQGRFVPAYRQVQAGEQRIQGTLERIDCPAGAAARFMVRDAAGLTPLEVARMADVDFISYRGDLTGSVSCGPLKEPMRVYVTWREGPPPGRQKTVVAVEFLPKN
jgi:Protein of unknown function (DUF1570)